MNQRGLYVLTVMLISCWRVAQSGYEPRISSYTSLRYNDTSGPGTVFPDLGTPSTPSAACTLPDGVSYFLSELNFEALEDRLLIGAANNLYLLSQSLECLDQYQWETEPASLATCQSDNTGDDQVSTCQNHIRLYKKIPSTDPPLMLVCGTQASVNPQCVTVSISNDVISLPQGPVDAANAIVSYYPEFADFGEFLNPSDISEGYFGVGFFQGDRGVGRDYQMAFYNVDTVGGLSISESVVTVVSEDWLNPPVTFIDYYRADYAPPTTLALNFAGIFGVTPQPYHYEFYFVFIRENTGQEVIHSQVVRICRNDPGVTLTPEVNPKPFSTYMKARIYCMIEVPPGRDFIGANDYIYNNIDSVVFNEDGRYGENADWFKTMYGAFSGPSIGPDGTAICGYPAHNSREQVPSADPNLGIFDIFREDLTMGGEAEMPNMFVECDAGGRDNSTYQWVDINRDVRQLTSNPLLVMDGITVTVMAVDTVCVVRSSDPFKCLNQDVLFLGTDQGTVIKVVFATVTENAKVTTDPVFAEEISLEMGTEEDRTVRELRIEEVGGVKRIFVSTDKRVYTLPIERCSRLQSCTACVGARDPYCVWNSASNACEATTLSVDGSAEGNVPATLWQDIHSGIVSGCNSVPQCTVTATAQSSTQFQCRVECDSVTGAVSFSASDPTLSLSECNLGELTLSDGRACATFTCTSGCGLQRYTCMVATTTTFNMAGPTFSDSTTTAVGVPNAVSADEIYTVCDQTSVTVCLQLQTLTDYLSSYNFLVRYGTSGVLTANTTMESLDTGDNCITISGQQPGSTLSYRVYVSNSQGSVQSDMLSHPLLEDVPGQVTGLSSPGDTATSVDLTWTHNTELSFANGVIIGYAVYVDGTKVTSCVLQSASSYTVTGLQPYTQYSFTVAACTAAGEGTESAPLVVTTDCAPPQAVSSLTLTGSSSTSIEVVWTAPTVINGNPAELDYDVSIECYDPDTGPTSSQPVSNTGATSRTIRNLQPLTTCCSTVSAYHTNCETSQRGPAIEACGQTSDTTPEMVTNFELSAIASDALFATWNPPANYQRPGITYELTVSPGGQTISVTERTNQYIGSLQASTSYTVTITAASLSESQGPSATATETTLPQPPSPPLNPSLSVNSNELVLSWDAPGSADPPVDSYNAALRCNDMDFPMTVTTTMATFDVSTVSGLAWCTAVVRAVNTVGSSEYSEQASTIRPATMPTKPLCFFTGNSATNASVSFTVTYPFNVGQTRLEWTLFSSVGTPVDGMRDFTHPDQNMVYVVVERDSSYEFELRMCNQHGCGEYCDRIQFNTETTTPSPPETISLDNSDCCSASISWTLPPNEVEGMVSYTVQLTSSCSRSGNVVPEIRTRSLSFSDLCADTQYTVAIQVTELQTNTTGVYSRPFTFSTTEGTPSQPRNLKVTPSGTVSKRETMIINWAVPEEPNGTIVRYDIEWSGSSVSASCGMPDDLVFRTVVLPPSSEFKAENVTNLNDRKSLLVCVRAVLKDGTIGEWASFQTADVTTGGLVGEDDQAAETCTNLIVVAVIASLAVLSSIILGVVLILVVCYNGWSPIKELKEKREEKNVDDYTKNKPRPGYNKSSSIQSTSSTAPMLRNGSVS